MAKNHDMLYPIEGDKVGCSVLMSGSEEGLLGQRLYHKATSQA
jgi:hypothetical protein